MEVRRLEDKEEIYAILSEDRLYAAYAIGDLESGLFEKCQWAAAYEDGQRQGAVPALQGTDAQRGLLHGRGRRAGGDPGLGHAPGTRILRRSAGAHALPAGLLRPGPGRNADPDGAYRGGVPARWRAVRFG